MAKYISLIGTPLWNEKCKNGDRTEAIINMNNFESIDIDAIGSTVDVNILTGYDDRNVTIAEMDTVAQASIIAVAIEKALDDDKIKVIKLRDIIESAIHPIDSDACNVNGSDRIFSVFKCECGTLRGPENRGRTCCVCGRQVKEHKFIR